MFLSEQRIIIPIHLIELNSNENEMKWIELTFSLSWIEPTMLDEKLCQTTRVGLSQDLETSTPSVA